MRRVVHVVSPQPRGDAGGAQLHVVDLATQQLESGDWQPIIVELGDKGMAADLAATGITAVTLQRPYSAGAVRQLRTLTTTSGASIIHSHGYDCDFLTASALRRDPRSHRAAWVATAHGFVSLGFAGRMKTAANIELLRRGPDLAIVTSESIADSIGQQGPTRVVANGVVIPPRAGADTQGSDVLRLLVAGRLSPEKRPELALDVLVRLSERRQVHCVFAGVGPMSDELRHRVAASGATNVTFEGFVGDMDAVYRRSHVLLLLSATEGTPRVVLEAMARGVVVIATAVGGVPSLIADGVTGFLVDPAPESVVTDVVARLDGLARDPDGSARITAAARESVLARFSIEAMHRLTADAYGEAMARRFTSRGRLLAAGRRRGRRRAN